MLKVNHLPPAEILSEWLSYDAETGEIRWKQDRWYNAKAGSIAGSICTTTGYRRIRLGKKSKFQAHRIAWALTYGYDPHPLEIDHIDGNRLNNRLDNLRTATKSQNQRNRRKLNKNNTTGNTGIYSHGDRYRAGIYADGKLNWIGVFNTKEEAVVARDKAAKERFQREYVN
jgi:hypothetical protein